MYDKNLFSGEEDDDEIIDFSAEKISFDPKRLLEGLTREQYVTVGEARRMSRSAVDKTQFPAFRKVMNAADRFISEPEDNEIEDEPQNEFRSPNMPIPETEPELFRPPKPVKKVADKSEKEQNGKQDEDEEEEKPLETEDLFDMIDGMENRRHPRKFNPKFRNRAPISAFRYDPYNTEFNDYDIEELTADIPTIEINNGYQLEDNSEN